MTKNEMINEIKNAVMNYGSYGQISIHSALIAIRDGELVRIINGCAKKVKYVKVWWIQVYLDQIKDYVRKIEVCE